MFCFVFFEKKKTTFEKGTTKLTWHMEKRLGLCDPCDPCDPFFCHVGKFVPLLTFSKVDHYVFVTPVFFRWRGQTPVLFEAKKTR